jgi:hypothetical protein
MNIQCTNCDGLFPDVDSFMRHRDGCRLKYYQKPHYKILGGEMPKRYGTQVRNALFDQVAEREGDWCIHCGFWPERDGPETPENELELHHSDNDFHNWGKENLHILCNKCNLEFRKYPVEVQIKMMQADCDRNVYVTQERKKLSNTEILRKKIDCSSAGAELQITSLCEVKLRNFVLNEVDRLGALSRDQIIDAGAEEVGCSIDTVVKYLRKLTSYRGPLESHKTETGIIITRRKHE